MAAREARKPKENCAARPDVRAVLAVGRRQDDAVAACCSKADRNVELSVSVTTRPKRPRRDQRARLSFHRPRAFDAMVKTGELLEWAEVFGHRYGTPRQPVEQALRAGRDVLFDIDWQGTQQLREKARDDLVSVFILPPTVDGAGTAAQAPGAGQPDRHRVAHGQGRRRNEPLAGIRLRYRQPRQGRGFRRSARDSRGRAAQARAADRTVRISCARCRTICKQIARDSGRQHRAADDAAGAQILERGLRLRERPLGVGSARCLPARTSSISSRASASVPVIVPSMVIALIANMRGGDREVAAEQAGHHDLAAARQHAGGELQRLVGADEIASRKHAAGAAMIALRAPADRPDRRLPPRLRRARPSRLAGIDVGDDRRRAVQRAGDARGPSCRRRPGRPAVAAPRSARSASRLSAAYAVSPEHISGPAKSADSGA